jgi:hypothetical protein
MPLPGLESGMTCGTGKTYAVVYRILIANK